MVQASLSVVHYLLSVQIVEQNKAGSYEKVDLLPFDKSKAIPCILIDILLNHFIALRYIRSGIVVSHYHILVTVHG